MDFFGLNLPLPSWLVYTIITLTFMYIYLTWEFRTFEKQGVKGPRPYPLVGNFHNAFRFAMHEYEMEMYRKFGSTFGLYEGRNPILYLADPDVVKRVLIKDFHKFSDRRVMNIFKIHDLLDRFLLNLKGDEWKSVRRVITPSFTQGKMKLMMPLVNKCSKDLIDNINKDIITCSGNVAMKKNFESFSMDLIGSCAFATELSSFKNPRHPFVFHARRIFRKNPIAMLAFLLPVNIMKKLKTLALPCDSYDYFERAVISVMAARKSKPQNRTDFLQLLMAAGENPEDDERENDNSNVKSEVTKPYKLSDEMIVSQAVMFFLAGFDTTSLALSFASYFLATNPECQEKLYREIQDVLEITKGKDPSLEELFDMKYLDMVVCETLRFYPPIPKTFRTAVEDVDLGVARIKKGQLIAVPIFAIHHDEKHYPEPEKFIPERFLDRSLQNSIIYLPFGTGPRNCIGMRFALIEVKTAIFQIVREFVLSPSPDTPIPLKIGTGMGFLGLKELNLNLKSRSK